MSLVYLQVSVRMKEDTMTILSRSTGQGSATMTVEAAADYIGISRATAYAEAQRYRASGGATGLPNIKLGGRVLVLASRLTELLGGDVGEPHDEREAVSGPMRTRLVVSDSLIRRRASR